MNISFVLWGGKIGGTERLALSLAGELQRMGHHPVVLLIEDDGDLRPQLDRESLEWVALGISPGRNVLREPRRVARALSTRDTEVAILGSFGFLGPALKIGGFRGVVIGVEHGALLAVPSLPVHKRALRNVDRRIGARGHDVEVAVSNFMLRLQSAAPHARDLVCIRHGVEVLDTPPIMPPTDRLRLGYVGRLIPGKGVDVAIRSMAQLRETNVDLPKLTVAGDGPEKTALETLARELNLADSVEFIGWTNDISGFWKAQHISVAPAHEFIESFCMTVVEAMAHGRPSIVSDRGALPELMLPGTTGSIVQPGSVAGLADAIGTYIEAPNLAVEQGAAAYSHARQNYTLRRCADDYIALARRVLGNR
jgi:glycosyltransferase involved in cell wall biosynthesis